jgi:hypothetical protein
MEPAQREFVELGYLFWWLDLNFSSDKWNYAASVHVWLFILYLSHTRWKESSAVYISYWADIFITYTCAYFAIYFHIFMKIKSQITFLQFGRDEGHTPLHYSLAILVGFLELEVLVIRMWHSFSYYKIGWWLIGNSYSVMLVVVQCWQYLVAATSSSLCLVHMCTLFLVAHPESASWISWLVACLLVVYSEHV